MRSRIILTTVLSILATGTLAFGAESGGANAIRLLKEALPQMVFIAVLLINLLTAGIDADRNFKASLLATITLVAITYWGGFYGPLLDFLATKL